MDRLKTDVLSCFTCMAMLTHDLFEIRFGQSSSTIWVKQLVYQYLYFVYQCLYCSWEYIVQCTGPDSQLSYIPALRVIQVKIVEKN